MLQRDTLEAILTNHCGSSAAAAFCFSAAQVLGATLGDRHPDTMSLKSSLAMTLEKLPGCSRSQVEMSACMNGQVRLRQGFLAEAHTLALQAARAAADNKLNVHSS